jgi:hypothetical protein
MSTTTSTFLAVDQNLARYQAMTAKQPDVTTATAYYTANIGSVQSAADLVKNYRLLSYALDAYGLGNQIGSTALIQKVLEGGVTNPKSLANTLPNPAWKAFAKAFDFTDSGSASPSSAAAVKTTTGDYVEEQLESNQGQQDPGVQLALYFQRVAPTVTSAYGILGNENMLEVVQTIFGLGSTSTTSQIDAEATAVSKLVPLSELQDPAKVTKLAERFGAAYDAKYGPSSGSTSSLTVVDGSAPTTVSGASSVLAGVVSSNATALSSLQTSTLFSAGLLESLQGVTLGG